MLRTDPGNYKTFITAVFLKPQVRNIFPYSSIKSSTSPPCNSEKLDHHPADEIEEFNYGSSSLEELYLHKNIGDFDWDDWAALFMINIQMECIVQYTYIYIYI